MNDFDKIINECFEILDMIELLIEEKDYMFIADHTKTLSKCIEFLKINMDNENIVVNKNIKKIENKAKEIEEIYNSVLDSDIEQKTIYKVYNDGIKPRINELRKLINEWNFKHKNKKPLKTSIIENKIFNY